MVVDSHLEGLLVVDDLNFYLFIFFNTCRYMSGNGGNAEMYGKCVVMGVECMRY